LKSTHKVAQQTAQSDMHSCIYLFEFIEETNHQVVK